VTGMSFGIVIDDTVHFLSKYLRARREKGLDAPDAVRYAFRTVGRALVVTTIVLVVGFSVLSTSSFQLNSGMGLMTAVIITIALISVFLLLPPLLMKIEEKSSHASFDTDIADNPAAA
jgi:predicted RND superfamily exporter protein